MGLVGPFFNEIIRPVENNQAEENHYPRVLWLNLNQTPTAAWAPCAFRASVWKKEREVDGGSVSGCLAVAASRATIDRLSSVALSPLIAEPGGGGGGSSKTATGLTRGQCRS